MYASVINVNNYKTYLCGVWTPLYLRMEASILATYRNFYKIDASNYMKRRVYMAYGRVDNDHNVLI